MSRFVGLATLLVVLLAAMGFCTNTPPAGATAWDEFHAAHPIHVFSVKWEDVRARELWARLMRAKTARSYHRWQDLRAAELEAFTGAPAVHHGPVDWDAIAACESGGRWDINTGNGYYGGLQFNQSTWLSNGGANWDGDPDHPGNQWVGPFPFSREEQIAVANLTYSRRGLQPWPNCGSRG